MKCITRRTASGMYLGTMDQTFSFCGLYDCNITLAIAHASIVPHEVKLPEIAMQVFAANVVVDANETTTNKRMAAFSSVNVSLTPSVFKSAMANGFMATSPASLEPTIRRKFIRHQFGSAVNVLPGAPLLARLQGAGATHHQECYIFRQTQIPNSHFGTPPHLFSLFS
jgi:hypothetical protein